MTTNELPTMGWPGIIILILCVLAFTGIIFYVSWRTKRGWNDAPENDEDNSILEWWRMRNEQRFK